MKSGSGVNQHQDLLRVFARLGLMFNQCHYENYLTETKGVSRLNFYRALQGSLSASA